MKYIIVLTDGMADLPIKELKNRTPMQIAKTPGIDTITKRSLQGMVDSIPAGMAPGSDVANLSIMGYDPRHYYTGRSSIEAAGIGIDLKSTDLTLRTNLITLEHKGSYQDSIIIDHGADDITSEEAYQLLDEIKKSFDKKNINFFKGMSYRHLLVLSKVKNTFDLTPPHDILNKKISTYLPAGENSSLLNTMMKESYEILKDHKINIERLKKGLNPANSIWFWGAGTKLTIPDFKKLRGLKGGVISAVDLVKGIGKVSGMKVIEVKGATGTIDTNFTGKAESCIRELQNGLDLIYLHVEAPDECGHKGELYKKIKSIEMIDKYIVRSILDSKRLIGPFKMMILPDHPTPVSLRTHTRDPVPFLIYDSLNEYDGFDDFSEETASKTGLYLKEGHKMIDFFISK